MLFSDRRPEDQLLICIARRDLDPPAARAIGKLLDRDELDWEHILTTAASHGIGALLAHHLQSMNNKRVPADVLSKLQNENQHNSRNSLWMTGELVKLSTAMHEAGIRCIPFKGPTLALAAYGDLGLRPFTDLDFFINKNDLARLKEVLSKRGFSPVRNLSRAREAALLRFDNACAFVNEDDLLLDVHWRFSPVYSSLSLETPDLWLRLERISIGGQTLSTLSAEDLFIVLCCHGFTHQWEKLIWICDLATLTRRREGLDWEYLLSQAKRLGVLRIVLVGIALARELNPQLPQQVVERMERDEEVRSLAHELGAQILKPASRGTEHSGWLRLHLRMRERGRDKFTSLMRIMLTPRDYDLKFASLPGSLSLLYYLLRPIRMARAYGLRLLNGSATH